MDNDHEDDHMDANSKNYEDSQEDIESLNVDLNIPDEDDEDEHDFKNDKATASIWSIDEAEKNEREEVLDKPSFLRRLTKRKQKHEKTDEDEPKAQ